MTDSKLNIDRVALEQLLNKRFFYAPSFGIYENVAGLFDFGPTGNALQQNLISLWRQHFVIEEDMLEVDCSIMTPSQVLKTSGHVDKFTDWMCKDTKTGEIFRADHLVEGVLESRIEGDVLARKMADMSVSDGNDKTVATDAASSSKGSNAKKNKKKGGPIVATKLDDSVVEEYRNILAQIDNFDGHGLAGLITKYDIRNPDTGNEVTHPVEFNLMFESNIGPTGHIKGYLRPETAQGQFVNFARLLDFNNQKMPFASAMIGRSFRNEISPRSGLLRVREFTMAEIEHYVDPLRKQHPRFSEAADIKVPLLPGSVQLEGKSQPIVMTIGEAVEKKIIDNQTLGYFLGRIYTYLIIIGIKPELLRFRQHLQNEMAHYACDCWDAEIKTSYGWIECVGCADRSAYDLTVHSNFTGEKLCVRENLSEPRVYEKLVCEPNSRVFGPKLKKAAKPVQEHLASLSADELTSVKNALAKDGKAVVKLSGTTADGEYEITPDMVSIENKTITEHVREYIPNVIEPSFGIGRILYSLIEHSFNVRADDEQRAVLSFKPVVAPFKCLVLPLSGHPSFEKPLLDVARRLRSNGVPARIDDAASASIGRRYARNDELGTPFAITVDFQTADDNTVTLRERDTTKQIRGSVEEIVTLVKDLVSGNTTWDDVLASHQLVNTAAASS
ncbi:Glycine--tRNA ligase 1, mitochondrial [Coemansia spiralis]|uniref:glycine--tRNA ligase n=2 Tax=Coemansia TaxID=4863 RepID=A0A9W8KY48_9FUNG|nr:Glycine--tRNA ligase 1, mitochondrial [Coemansia umbellata]KAJ2625327.1 Glycine--tRNA ligase 1, mitochondrial [Coemansia sp. RSA 1358]KAJ2676204.1 Glycine--tRNA ligase 1, mitochondrial [Coemansia spiralis]